MLNDGGNIIINHTRILQPIRTYKCDERLELIRKVKHQMRNTYPRYQCYNQHMPTSFHKVIYNIFLNNATLPSSPVSPTVQHQVTT